MRNHGIRALFLAATALCAGNLPAQVPTAFDNIRITPANPNVGKLVELSNDTIAAASITLLDLLKIEFPLYSPDRVRGLTGEQLTKRFDVVGKIDAPGVSHPEHDPHAYLFVVHALLKNHFRLATHEASEDTGSLDLVLIPGGIPPTPCEKDSHRPRIRADSHLTNRCLTAFELATQLSQQLAVAIDDDTNLRGAYAFNLDWAPALAGSPQSTAASPQSRRALPHMPNSLGLALAHDDLWLRPRHMQQRILVVDHAEFPASLM